MCQARYVSRGGVAANIQLVSGIARVDLRHVEPIAVSDAADLDVEKIHERH